MDGANHTCDELGLHPGHSLIGSIETILKEQEEIDAGQTHKGQQKEGNRAGMVEWIELNGREAVDGAFRSQRYPLKRDRPPGANGTP